MNASDNDSRSGLIRIGVVVLIVLCLAGAVGLFLTRGKAVGAAEHGQTEDEEGHKTISVKAVHPRLDPNFQMTVERPCTVEAYYTDNVKARAAGMVKYLRVTPGSKVKKDQLLVEIDVPDRVGDVKEKAATVEQRRTEVKLAEEKVEKAKTFLKTAEANIVVTQRDAEYRKKDYDRLYALRLNTAVDQSVVDISFFHWKKAEAGILKAKAELEDAHASVRVANAEVKQKEALVHVAEGDEERAKALLEYASVKAPYDATVVERLVNPGDTVQDATRGNPTPMLILERKDIVTVGMQLPDNYVSFVTPGTEAIMEFTSLPGLKIHGKVTRYSDSLTSPQNDRTMRVEVDLWNGSEQGYDKFMADPVKRGDLKDGPLPLRPQFVGLDRLRRSTNLKAKMYGNMTLILRNFGKTHLVPSNAIRSHGGRTRIFLVKDGEAHLMPVEVVVDDGSLAMVLPLDDKGRVTGSLTGSEEVIVSNQEELTEGQPVKATLVDDWKSIETKKSR